MPKVERCLHEWKYTGFAAKCKPLVTLKTRKEVGKIVFVGNIVSTVLKNKQTNFGQMKPRVTNTKMIIRDKH